jgi:hypothetical protein
MSDETAVDHGTDGAGREDASLGRVETLMAERRKYEGWLEALEARRASTPERVFTRVHGDYHDRLDAVIQQLKEHTEGLRAEDVPALRRAREAARTGWVADGARLDHDEDP